MGMLYLGFPNQRYPMKEPAFIKRNAPRWERFEQLLNDNAKTSPDEQAELYMQLTDDLSYAQTFYPGSDITRYLNGLTQRVHQKIYVNQKERRGRVSDFWKYELPWVMYESRKQLLASFIIFTVAIIIGALSAANDDTFVRLIMGDAYVNMTLDNIDKGDPMAVYKGDRSSMFSMITWNNIRVSFMAFMMGVFASLGTAWVLVRNGIMLGAFQYFFYQKGLFLTSFLTIWIHGTLEISAIVIAGAAGIVMGNSILYPGTYSRAHSFMKGAKKGIKIIIGLIPIFILAGFLESFVTRLTDLHPIIKLGIILFSLAFVVSYFWIYPRIVHERGLVPPELAAELAEEDQAITYRPTHFSIKASKSAAEALPTSESDSESKKALVNEG